MSTKEVRFGIMGCGRIGARHAEKLQSIKSARLVAVYDTVPDLAKKLKDDLRGKYKIEVKHYVELNDFLADPEIDFVNVCTPSGLHSENTITALNAGKNVLCEKPMALKVSDAEAMVSVAKKNNKLLFVVKQNRFNPPVRLVTKLLKEGKLGKPIKCVANILWNRNEDYYKQAPWRGTKELAGGALFTLASHFVDLITSFMGEPKNVFAYIGRGGEFTETEDTGIISAEFKNGGYGALNYTACVTNKNIEGSITLVSQKGTIRIGGEYLNTLDAFQVEGFSDTELEEMRSKTNNKEKYEGSMSNHEGVFEAIVNHVNGAPLDEALVSGETALTSVRFMEKAYESAKTGKRVDFA